MTVTNVATPALAVVVAVLVLGPPHTTRGDDIEAIPGPGDSFSVRDSGDTKSQLEVKESGETFVRGAKDMPAAGADTPLCYDATGQLGTCPPVIGPTGPTGPAGPGVCVPDVTASPRFVDNGDGTVTDLHTCLMWEQKTGTVGSFIDCSAVTCSNPHVVNNLYKWTVSGTAPDGGVYTDFLERVNGKLCSVGDIDTGGTCTGLGGHTDWLIPTIAELQSILLVSFPCAPTPCIDSIFGPTVLFLYWSATTDATFPTHAWDVNFTDGLPSINPKTGGLFVRAVRGGS